MIEYDLSSIFSARGVKRGYTFLKKLGITHSLAHRMVNGNIKSMSMKHMEKICVALHCTPNELLKWTPDNDQLPADHPLQSLRRTTEADINILEEIEKLPLDKMEALKEQIRKMSAE